MSNLHFTGVSNEDSPNKITASSAEIDTINAQTIKTKSISYDSVQISGLPTSNNIVTLGASGHYPLTSLDMSLVTRGLVLYQNNGNSSTIINLNTADSADEAIRLLALFNITDATTTRLIQFSRVNTIGTGTISIGSPAAVGTSFVYVKFAAAGVSIAEVKQFSGSNSTRDAYILVYRGTDYLSNKTIVFDVIGAA
jgi:hypothetical protein